MNLEHHPDPRATPDAAPSLGFVATLVAMVAAVLAFGWLGRSQSTPSVVLYCAQDMVYAEPILMDFERETGIRVRKVYDNEAVKTTGLANRLIAEQANPVCDVFWGNEELRTRQLGRRGVFERWTAFGYRSRRIVVNTNLVPAQAWPRSILDLTNAAWAGRVALAYPQFGTTGAHLHALRQRWGESTWQQWLEGLIANRALVVDGNSVVVKLVGKGEAWIGLTDSDDIAAAQREGLPVAALETGPEMLFIPNTVAVVRGRPETAAVGRLVEFLRSSEVVERLVKAHALEGAVPPEGGGLVVDWDSLLREMETVTAELNRIFLRK